MKPRRVVNLAHPATLVKSIILALCAIHSMMRSAATAALLMFLSCLCSAQSGRARDVFQPGEELRYAVKWQFIRLGTITVRTDHDPEDPAGAVYTVHMNVESNPALQFIWIREVTESHMDVSELNSLRFLGRYRNGDDLTEVRESYDVASRTGFYRRSDMNAGRVLLDTSFRDVPRFVEGPSLLFAARVLSRSMGVRELTTLVEGGIHSTTLSFGGEIENLQIDAWDQEIRTRKLEGHADWSGGTGAGLIGRFAGWMSDDDAAVPIRAQLKVLLGSVTLELERWTRAGWVPPSTLSAAATEGRQP
jgi:hypothetical protein